MTIQGRTEHALEFQSANQRKAWEWECHSYPNLSMLTKCVNQEELYSNSCIEGSDFTRFGWRVGAIVCSITYTYRIFYCGPGDEENGSSNICFSHPNQSGRLYRHGRFMGHQYSGGNQNYHTQLAAAVIGWLWCVFESMLLCIMYTYALGLFWSIQWRTTRDWCAFCPELYTL